MKDSAERVSHILKRVIRGSNLVKMNECRIKTSWTQMVGKEVAVHTEPGFLKKGKLLVSVDSPAWAYELSTHLKKAMLAKINETMGSKAVKDIQFKVGTITR